MANIHNLRLKLAIIRAKQEKERYEKVRETIQPKRAELYMKDRLSGMTYAAIARKHSVSPQAVGQACARYRRWMDQKKEGAEDG